MRRLFFMMTVFATQTASAQWTMTECVDDNTRAPYVVTMSSCKEQILCQRPIMCTYEFSEVQPGQVRVMKNRIVLQGSASCMAINGVCPDLPTCQAAEDANSSWLGKDNRPEKFPAQEGGVR